MADTPLTIAKTRVTPLTSSERWNGYNTKFKIKYSDIACGTGSTDTVTLTLGSSPARWMVSRVFVNVTTSFVGTGTQTFAMKIGDATDDDDWIASTAMLSQAVGALVPSTGPNTVANIANCKGTTTATFKVIFTNAAAGSPSALTAGELDIYANILNLDEMG